MTNSWLYQLPGRDGPQGFSPPDYEEQTRLQAEIKYNRDVLIPWVNSRLDGLEVTINSNLPWNGRGRYVLVHLGTGNVVNPDCDPRRLAARLTHVQ